MNENIAPSEVTDNVGDERGDAFRGMPKLSCLDIPWILTWGALGIPKLRILVVLEYYLGVPWASPILGSFHSLFHSPSNPYPKLENFTTQNLTENS